MGKTIALVCAGLIVAAGAISGMYSYGLFCDGGDHGCCNLPVTDCCGSDGCTTSEKDAAASAAIAVAGPAAATPGTSQIITNFPPCCSAQAKTLAAKPSCCEDECCTESSGLKAVVGVTATTTK